MGPGEAEDIELILKVLREARRKIDDAAGEIFQAWHARLLAEPLSYAVYAVWGVRKDGTLTSDQKAINGMVEPLIAELSLLLELDLLGPPQKHAVLYALRELVITKLIMMTEIFRGKIKAAGETEISALENLEPFGHA